MRTGVQRKVLSLYKQFLLEIKRKPLESQDMFYRHIRSRFAHDLQQVGKRDFEAIEYYLRRGEKQLDTFKSPQVTRISI